MNSHIQDHVFADGVDQHGNLILKIGPGHPLARMNAVDRSRLISGAPGLLAAMKGLTSDVRFMAKILDATITKTERGDWE